jgi:hypothetical protein
LGGNIFVVAGTSAQISFVLKMTYYPGRPIAPDFQGKCWKIPMRFLHFPRVLFRKNDHGFSGAFSAVSGTLVAILFFGLGQPA